MGFNFDPSQIDWNTPQDTGQGQNNVPDNLYMPGSGAVTNQQQDPYNIQWDFGQDFNNQYTQPENTYNNPYSGPYLPQYMPVQPEGYQYIAPRDDTTAEYDWNKDWYGQQYAAQQQPEWAAQDESYTPPQGQVVASNDQTGQQLVVPQDNSFLGGLYRAAVLPSEVNAVQNDRQGKMPWDVGLEALGNVAQGTLGALGQALSPLGGGVDAVANSNIPVVSQAGQLVRGAVENVVEPVLNFTPSAIGDISKGEVPHVLTDAISNLNPFDDYDKASITQAKLGYVQDAYNSAIAAGKSDEEASQVAQTLDRKLGNFAQLSEYQGLQQFGTLPALAQLGIMLLDPVANLGSEVALAGRLPRGLSEGRIANIAVGGGRVADVAETAQRALNYANPINYLGKAARADGDVSRLATGEGALSQYQVKADEIAPIIQRHADDTGVTPQEAIRQFLYDPTSPVYKDTLGADPYMIDTIDTTYNALPPEKVGSDSVLQPGEEYQRPGVAEQGYNVQDTNGTIPFDEAVPPVTNKYNPVEPGSITPKVQAQNASSTQEFKDAFTASPQPKSPLPDTYKGVSLPREGGDVAEYFGAGKQIYGIDRGAIRQSTVKGNITKPVLEYVSPLDEFGPLSPALKTANRVTNTLFTRPFLNTASRGLVRDPLGNFVKLGLTDPAGLVKYFSSRIGKVGTTDARYEAITGRAKSIESGPASITGDISGKYKSGSDNPLATLYYTLANPQNEIPALIARKLSKGKFKDFSVVAENLEADVKDFQAKREFLRKFDNTIDKMVSTQQLPKYLGDLAKVGKLDEAAIGDFLKNKMPAGADLSTMAAGVYNPADLSKSLRARDEVSKVLAGQGGPIGDILNKGLSSIQARVDSTNAERITARDNEMALIKRLKDPVMREKRLAALDKPPYKLLDISDVSPDHSIFTGWLDRDGKYTKGLDDIVSEEVNNIFAAHSAAAVTPEVLQAYNQFTREALAYSKRSGDLSAFRQTLESDIASREPAYSAKYNQTAAPTPQTRLPGTTSKAPNLDKPQYQELQKILNNLPKGKHYDLETKSGEKLNWYHSDFADWLRNNEDKTQPYKFDFVLGKTDFLDGDAVWKISDKTGKVWYDRNPTPQAPASALGDVQQKALDWATKRYQLTSNRGVTDLRQLDDISKSNKGRGIQLSQVKKWINNEPLGKSADGKALMYEEGKGTYWMSKTSKAYDPANEVPRGKVEASAPQTTTLDADALERAFRSAESSLPTAYRRGSKGVDAAPGMAQNVLSQGGWEKFAQDTREKIANLKDPELKQKWQTQLDAYQKAIDTAAPQAAPTTTGVDLNDPKIKAAMQNYYEQFFKTSGPKPSYNFSANDIRDRINNGANLDSIKSRVVDADNEIRRITGNRFKLDLETMTPIGRPGTSYEGQFLTDLAGRGKPQGKIESVLPPKLPAELSNMGMEDTLKTIEQHYGQDAYKQFDSMEPAERDAKINEMSEAILGVQPNNPLTPLVKGLDERDAALKLWQDFKNDINTRYKEDLPKRSAAAKTALDDKAVQEKTANEFRAARNQAEAEGNRAGYQANKDVFLDYRNKNKVDQLLGSVLPFQYWARQNFAFVAKHFAAHPAHFAAILNFYKQLEQENADPSIPDYAKGDIFLWQNPDGSKVMWDFSSILPFNPLGSNDSVMQVVSPGDSTGRSTKNTDPLAILIGSDVKSVSTGKVTGRDKGILSSFIRPNPILELAFKTGNVNNLLTSLGVTKGDQTLLGQDYTEEARAQKETSGFLPGNSFYQEIGAATGITDKLRQAGLVKGDLSPQSIADEMLFGRNAGKPQTKIIQELTSMAQRKEISPEQAKLAIAGYKEGNWTPEALKALDLVQGENASRRLLTNMGFTSIVLNTPRQQLTNKLYSGLSEAYDGDKSKTIVGPDGKKIYVPSDASKYYASNPGASVLTSANDTSQQIRQGLSDDKTRQAYSDLVQQSQAKSISARDFNLQLAKLQATNPQYFVDHPLKQGPKEQLYNEQLQEYQGIGGSKYDELSKRAYDLSQSGNKTAAAEIYNSKEYKDAQTSRNQFMTQHPEFKQPYVDYLKSKGQDYKEPDPAQAEYFDKLDAYNKIGGDPYDKLSAALSKAYDNNDKKAQAAIFANPVYQRGKASRDQFILDNPAFNQQYKEYLQSKGFSTKEVDPNSPLTGSSKYPTTSKSSTYTSSGKSYPTSSSSKKSTYVPYAQYKAQQTQAKKTTTRLPSTSNTASAPAQTRQQVAALTAKKPAGTVGKVASVPAATAEDLTTRGWDGKYFPADFGRTDANVWKYSGEAVQDAQKLMAQDDSITAIAVYSTDLKGYFVYTKDKGELSTRDISLINAQNKLIGLPPTTLTAKPKEAKVSTSLASNSSTPLTNTINGGKIIKNNNTATKLPAISSSLFKTYQGKGGGGGSRNKTTRLPKSFIGFSPGVSVRKPQVIS